MRRLFLFDIDGTLMRGTGPHHEQALVAAIRQVAGIESTMKDIPVHGMLDQDILRDMMLREHLDAEQIRTLMPEIVRQAQLWYPERCPDLREKVLRGVREVLDEIAAHEHPIGVVTGNLTRIGWTKLERAGLRDYFRVGAFAEMGSTRAELARMAWVLAGATPATRVTLIGDSPSDVEAARENGFRCVAVATGLTSREALESLGADLVLNDLSGAEERERLIQG